VSIFVRRAPDFSPGRAEETHSVVFLRQLKLAARRLQEETFLLAPERKLFGEPRA